MFYRGNDASKKHMKLYEAEKNKEIAKKRKITSIKTLISKNLLSKALQEVEDYLEMYPNDSYGLLQQGNIYYHLELFEDAKKTFQYIVDEKLESQYAAKYSLGLIAIKEGKYDQAENYFRDNIESSPYAEVFSVYKLASIRISQGRYDSALDVINAYGDLNNDDITIMYSTIIRLKGNPEQALKILDEHNFSFENQVLCEYYEERGFIETDLKNYKEAKSCFEKAEKYAFPKQLEKLRIEKACVYLKKKDYVKAYKLCTEACYNINSDYLAKVYLTLGDIYLGIGDFSKAEEYYKKSLEKQYYFEPRGIYYLGNLYILKQDYDTAKKYFFEFLDKSENIEFNNSAYLKLSIIEYKQKNISKSREYYDIINPENLISGDIDFYKYLRTAYDYMDGIIYNNPPYAISQLYNYDVNKLIDHIDKVHEGNDCSSWFNKDVDLEQLVYEVPKLLENAKLIENIYHEVYLVKYDNIGYIDGESTNYLAIVLFPDTKKVVTMYPHSEIPSLDNYNDKGKVKQKSRIDKFNHKYGIKSNN